MSDVEVGMIGVQGKYFSDRLMMVTDDHSPLFTISCHINITRIMAVLIELSQTPEGTVDFDKINSMIKL